MSYTTDSLVIYVAGPLNGNCLSLIPIILFLGRNCNSKQNVPSVDAFVASAMHVNDLGIWFNKQEAQLLLRWPTHGAKSIYLEVKVIELN